MAIRRPELQKQRTTWINLKDIILSERSKSQKVAHYIIPCMWHSSKDKTTGTENRSVIAKSSGCGETGTKSGYTREFFRAMELFRILIVVAIT